MIVIVHAGSSRSKRFHGHYKAIGTIQSALSGNPLMKSSDKYLLLNTKYVGVSPVPVSHLPRLGLMKYVRNFWMVPRIVLEFWNVPRIVLFFFKVSYG